MKILSNENRQIMNLVSGYNLNLRAKYEKPQIYWFFYLKKLYISQDRLVNWPDLTFS